MVYRKQLPSTDFARMLTIQNKPGRKRNTPAIIRFMRSIRGETEKAFDVNKYPKYFRRQNKKPLILTENFRQNQGRIKNAVPPCSRKSVMLRVSSGL